MKKQIRDKVLAIIDTYFSSDEGKEYVIDAIKREIDNSDLLNRILEEEIGIDMK